MAGIIGAFIAAPLAFFSKKGSKIHIYAGRCFVISILIICLTGYWLDWHEIVKILHLRLTDKDSTSFTLDLKMHVLISTAINTFALYLAASGWRIANRHSLPNIKTLFDSSLAMIEIFFTGIFLYAFFINLALAIALDYNKITHLLIHFILLILIIIMYIDARHDLMSAISSKPIKYWWITHLRKMFIAEFGLLAAFLLRCYKISDIEWIIIICTAGFILLLAINIIKHAVLKHSFVKGLSDL